MFSLLSVTIFPYTPYFQWIYFFTHFFLQVGYFPSAVGAESLSTLLDESSLLRHCQATSSKPGVGAAAGEAILPMSEAVQSFRYFALDNGTVAAVLEEPLGNDQDSQPTVTVLLRTATGRSAWSMQLRQLPRHKSGLNRASRSDPVGRPLPLGEVGVSTGAQPKFFPETIDRIPLCKA